MEENVRENELCAEGGNALLEAEASAADEAENSQHTYQQLPCISAGKSRLELQGLPIALQLPEDSQASQNASEQGVQNQPDEFIIFDQNGQPIPYERMMIVSSQSENGPVYVIPSSQLGAAHVLLPQGQLLDVTDTPHCCEDKVGRDELQTVAVTAIADSTSNYVAPAQPVGTLGKNTAPSSAENFAVPLQPLPLNTPPWARRLRGCEKIGDSYRGYCASEVELEAVLTLHKQQTHSVWGTRQSPSPAKPATRLMWKSQYVPYDGIPFVNAGNRAIVMECQFGPRRKGVQPKKSVEHEIILNHQYKATCPARIYIKKVRKFPEYRVPTDPKVDKKIVRQEQEKAFFNLKKSLWEAGGVLRYYVQLPTQKAHLYHDMDAPYLPLPPGPLPPPEEEEPEEEELEPLPEDTSCVPSRLHPRVAEKICELVSQGMHQVYMVRKQLRKFVERELFKPDEVPERHNLCYFPTVNDIKNHIHEAQKALQQGDTDYITHAAEARWTTGSENPLTETVTLTLAPTTVEVSSQKTGGLEGSDTLSPEAVQLFSSLTSLQPKIFAQLHGIQLQPSLGPGDGAPSLVTVMPQGQPTPLCPAPELLDSGSPPAPQLLLSPAQFLQPSASLSESSPVPPALVNVSLPDPALLGMGQLVTVSALGEGAAEGGMHQILLGDGQTIPVHIVGDPGNIAHSSPLSLAQVKVELEENNNSSSISSAEN
ncbi:calcium-responsive transcription factor [Amia ocellicauda]|uniref:calcium-responsive transcription factor n=1 Tax=Amia ocellicauda TaxID=2972642 RepID=UPI003464767D|nr:CARTF factor [Amia calva]